MNASKIIRGILLASCVACFACLSACSSGNETEVGGGVTNRVKIVGVVLNMAGEPLSEIAIFAPSTADSVLSESDGSFEVEVLREDTRVQIGGEEESSFVVHIDITTGNAASVDAFALSVAATEMEAYEIARPFFLENRDNGFRRGVPSGAQVERIQVDDPALPGFSLTIEEGASVAYPVGAPEESVFLLGLSHDRLPLPLPGGRLTRMSAMVGPLGASFSPEARLRIPNVDGLAPGVEADAFFLDSGTGVWEPAGTVTVATDGVALESIRVKRGGIYVALPRTVWPEIRLVARILGSGNEPLPNYLAVTQGGAAATSDADGFIRFEALPVWPDEDLRLQIVAPNQYRHEFIVSVPISPLIGEPETDAGRILVSAILRSDFSPFVSYNPPLNAGGITEFPRISARFDRPMDLNSIDIKVVRGVSREQIGVRGTKFLRFIGNATEIEFIPLDPLKNGEFYTIFVPKTARDTEGNFVDQDFVLSRFTVRDAPPDIGDQEIRVLSVVENQGIAGDMVSVGGVHLRTPSVRFGNVLAAVPGFDDVNFEFLEVTVPPDISGEVIVQVENSQGDFEGNIPFRALPWIDNVGDSRAFPPSAENGFTSRTIFGLGAHLGGAPRIVWNGAAGGTFVSLSDEDCPIELQVRRKCFGVALPDGVAAGSLYLEVDGFRTRSFFVVAARDLPAGPTIVTGGNAADGFLLASESLIVEFSSFLALMGKVRLSEDGVVRDDVISTITHDRARGGSSIRVDPPAGTQWTDGKTMSLAATSLQDLSGQALGAVQIDFTIGAPPPPPPDPGP